MIAITTYVVLISAFVEDRLTASEFEQLFLALFKLDPGGRPQFEYAALEQLFGDVDAFVDDVGLRQQTLDGIGPDELRRSALRSLQLISEGEKN